MDEPLDYEPRPRIVKRSNWPEIKRFVVAAVVTLLLMAIGGLIAIACAMQQLMKGGFGPRD